MKHQLLGTHAEMVQSPAVALNRRCHTSEFNEEQYGMISITVMKIISSAMDPNYVRIYSNAYATGIESCEYESSG